MSSMAEYLKRYTASGADDEKKKKKKKSVKSNGKQLGMRVIEDDAFVPVAAAKAKEVASDEEMEEIEVLKESIKKAKINPGFKKTFAEVAEIKKEIKEEVLSPDNSPPRRNPRQRHDSDDDNSPVRRSKRQRHDSDNSPPRDRRNNDKSEARKRHDSDNSPPRRSRQRHDSDNSPPRKTRQRHDSDNSPPRKKRHDSDNSPRRRSRSPPRRNRHDSDCSPPRKREKDLSPPRRSRKDSDNSPPRRRIEKPEKIKKEEPDDVRTLDGKKAGLQSAKDLKEEGDRIRERNAKVFSEMDSSVSGRFADTVYRKKQTRKGGKDSEEQREKKEREAKKTEELREKYKDWNRGVAQMERRKDTLEEMARVAAEPLTRHRNDEEMNRHLKEVLHEMDPMANMIKQKRRNMAIDRGELVYPTYQGTWVPNRFNIPPGYRWDGVDRSNGWEGKLARAENQKTANQAEYYKSIAEYE